MANKEDLIKFCRYFKDEAENPWKDCIEELLWEWEKKWVEFTLNVYKGEQKMLLNEMLNEYIAVGLRIFNDTDDTPATLKALLFNRYLHLNKLPMKEGVESFKDFYDKTYYKKSPRE